MANIANPYRVPIDPDNADSKKTNFKTTKGLDENDKFDLTSKNIGDFKDQAEEATHIFCFCSMLFTIPISYDVDGDALDTKNLVTEPNTVFRQDSQECASQVWGNVDGIRIIDLNCDIKQELDVLQ